MTRSQLLASPIYSQNGNFAVAWRQSSLILAALLLPQVALGKHGRTTKSSGQVTKDRYRLSPTKISKIYITYQCQFQDLKATCTNPHIRIKFLQKFQQTLSPFDP